MTAGGNREKQGLLSVMALITVARHTSCRVKFFILLLNVKAYYAYINII